MSAASDPHPHPFFSSQHCDKCHDRFLKRWTTEHYRRRRLLGRKLSHRESLAAYRDTRQKLIRESLFGEGPLGRSRELELWAAVLSQAIEDFASKSFRSIDAEKWFLSTDTAPPSFHWICGQFNIDPVAARERILSTPHSTLRRQLHPSAMTESIESDSNQLLPDI